MVKFPSELPFPDSNGYRYTPVSPFIRTELSSGRARQRRRFTSVPVYINVSWIMSDSEFELFEGWFRHSISDGVDWFIGGLKTGRGFNTTYEQRFSSMYSAELIDQNLWRVTAAIELRDRHTASAEEAEFPLELIYSSLFDKTMNRHWPDA